MATAKKTTSSKEKALAGKMVHLRLPAKNKCVPLKCDISGGPCAYLVNCDPMSCGGLKCTPLKSV